MRISDWSSDVCSSDLRVQYNAMNNDVNGQYINNPLSARFDKKFATMHKCHCRKSTGDNNIIYLRLANQSNVLNRPSKEKEQNNRYKPYIDNHILQFRS